MTMVAAVIADPPAIVLTMDGQALPVTGWADDDGVCVEPEAARFCTAGPDTRARYWLVDIRRLERVR